MTDAERARYSAVAVLKDGGSIAVRALRPDDRERLTDHFSRLSPQSVYFRFFRAKKHLTESELHGFLDVDFVRRGALVATLRDRGPERILGVARWAVVEDAPHRAEVAFAVDDTHQGRGIGTVLLEHLAVLAHEAGITEFEADVMGENNRMLSVFANSGFRAKRSIEGGVFHLSFPVEETEEFAEARDRRERAATAESVRPLLAPKSVAIVGASERPGTIGAALLQNVRGCGFGGPIYPVHPTAKTLGGLPAFRHVSAVGAPIDLAIVAVPAAAVEEVVADCARSGVRSVVVISAGFAETGPAGRATEERIRDLVRGSGMRMVGPNCLGVLNTDPEVSLNATFAPTWPPAGNVSMSSQSGALGLAILEYVGKLNIGIASFVSVGNKADVSGNDLLSYWLDDPRTGVILLYLESFGNPRKFARLAPEVARVKPIVAVKSGRSAAGTRAASSHSAALANLDVAVETLFEQAGVIRTATLEELFDVAALLSTQPVPSGRRVGVVTNAGGPGILLADACEAHGLELPTLAGETLDRLRAFLPPAAGLSNPIDMIASATPEQYERTVATVGADPSVDSLVVIYVPPMVSRPEDVAQAIARGAGAVAREKPILTVFLSARGAPPMLSTGPRGPLPSYTYPENAAQALAAGARYGEWRRRPRGTAVHLDAFARSAVRAVVDRVLADATEPVWLSPTDLATVLCAADIELAVGVEVPPAEAPGEARRMGFPLVAKAVAPGLVHKTDVGGVVLNLESEAAVRTAVATLEERMRVIGKPLDAVLLQRQVAGGIEALVGVTSDPTFGPLLVVGLGGVFVELLRDVAYRFPPVTDLDAEEMLRRLRAGRLLDGYRGAPPGDRAALVRLVQRLSALVEVVPELRELDLNPVKVLAPGKGAIAVDGRMRIGPTGGLVP
jgi:acetyl coenzyme A synthetase (ADP forming)-like protein